MSWLAALIAEVAAILIKQLGGDLLDYLKKKEELAAIQKKAQEDANKSIEPLQKAQTGDEIDAAARDAFDGV